MDSSKRIGEDGSGKNIGKEMKDGGKAGTKDMEGILTMRDRRRPMGLPDRHFHRHLPDLLEKRTIKTTALTAGKARYKSQASSHRLQAAECLEADKCDKGIVKRM